MASSIRTAKSYIDLVLYKTWADLRSEARRYYIAYAWWVLEPILEMLVFYLVFAVLLKRGQPNFVQFLLVGLVTWKWFETTVKHCGNSILGSRNLVRQVAISKIFFPTVVIATDTFKAMIAFAVVFIFVLSGEFGVTSSYLSLPFLFLVQILFITAVGFTFAAITPFFPDFMIITSHILRLVFFLSGIFFNPQNIPEPQRSWLFLNPAARLIEDYRGVILYGTWPESAPLLTLGLISICWIVLVCFILNRYDTKYPRIVAQ